MLTSKQRAYLRSLANSMDAIVQVGKTGIGEELIKQVDDALEARELIKVQLLLTAPSPVREVADSISDAVNAEVVQVIGRRFVLYRKKKKDPVIILPKVKK